MICESTGRECKQVDSCEARGCFKDRLSTVGISGPEMGIPGFIPHDSRAHEQEQELVQRAN